MKIGIVGLPNVGKSTLFTALTKRVVPAENYPFCTIEPNVGIVPVPDLRLRSLATVSRSNQTIPTIIEFMDIAGLVAGAHKGEGLGNKFLSHIRNVDAIVEVVRGFESSEIHHIEGSVNPKRDIETISLELIMSDLELVEKRVADLSKKARGNDKESSEKLSVLEKIKPLLNEGRRADAAKLTEDEVLIIKELNLLTLKPILYVFNIINQTNASLEEHYHALLSPSPTLFLNIQTEAELIDVPKNELQEYLTQFNLSDTGLNKLIQSSYALLRLITFFTSGEKETRGWTVARVGTAPIAAGKIHSDIEQGFIRAEVINWKNFVDVGGWGESKEKGLVRIEGKEYVIADGDVCYFRFAPR